jgi:hypothetical protein
MNQGRDTTVRGLLMSEYGLDAPVAEKVLGQLQGKVEAKQLGAAARARVVAGTTIEDARGGGFNLKMEQVGDTWLQASYGGDRQRLFVVSMEVPARYRGNHLGTDLLSAAIQHAERTRGPVATVTGEAGGTNLSRLRTPGMTVADTPFGKAMDALNFEATYDPVRNILTGTRRSGG